MLKILKTVEKNFGILLLLTAFFAFLFPSGFLPLRSITDELLMFALFLGCLKINFADALHVKANLGTMGFFIVLNIVLLPLAFFMMSFWLDADIRIGLFMLMGVSGAVATPLLASFLELKILWSSVFVILTSVLVPLTLPLLIKWCFGIAVDISMVGMMLFLAKIIFIPAVLAVCFRRFLPKLTLSVFPYTGFVGSLTISLFLGVVVALNQTSLSENLFHWSTMPVLFMLFALFIFRFFLGFSMPANSQAERWTNSLMFGNMNNGLVVLLAAEFFTAKVLFVVLLSEVPWILAQPVFQKLVHKYHKE